MPQGCRCDEPSGHSSTGRVPRQNVGCKSSVETWDLPINSDARQSAAIARPCKTALAVMTRSQSLCSTRAFGGTSPAFTAVVSRRLIGALTRTYSTSHINSRPTAVAAAAVAVHGPLSAASAPLTAAAMIPRAPGTGIRRSPYRCIFPTTATPITATRARSSTRARAGRCTTAQKTPCRRPPPRPAPPPMPPSGQGRSRRTAHLGSRLVRQSAHLRKHLQRVQFVPMFGEHAVFHAPDIDGPHLDSPPGARDAHELAAVRPSIDEAADDTVTGDNDVLGGRRHVRQG